jgi:ATP-dependent DNA helicase RecQ
MNLSQVLKHHLGFDQFRQGQAETIDQLLSGHSSLAIFPTGSGKSLCYQLTATQLPHLTLVVSPLLALIKDQLDFLKSKGIAAASIDSTLTPQEHQQVMADAKSGVLKVLMVSVERFKNERFRQFIQSIKVSMLVVDEAHCISEWGHNFRPDYLKLPQYRQELNIPLVLLLTATATKKVKLDMASKFNIQESHIVQTGFYRPNLDLSVEPVNENDKTHTLLHHIKQQQGLGIVYVTLQHTAEKVADYLTSQGVNAKAYHAGFDNEVRQQIQADFMANRVQVIVATIAFGMGIDKSDIRFVIHYDLPKSIENYSQEIGRAGRDGLASKCITLANLDGLNTVENFVFGDTPELSGIEYILNNIRNESLNSQWELQIVGLSNDSNVRQLPLKTLLVQLELAQAIKPKYSYFAEFKYKFVSSDFSGTAAKISLGKQTIANMFDGERQKFIQAIFNHTQFKKVWGDPNFNALNQHYASDRLRAITALEYLQEKQLIEIETKKMTDVFSVDLDVLNNPELVSTLHDYFVEKEQKEIKRIAALVRFFELDKCLSSMLSRYFDDQAAPASCGHCSVCRGHIAKLSHSMVGEWPSDEKIQSDLGGLSNRLSEKVSLPLSNEVCCRFLTGLSIPLFSRNKVRTLSGFGSCESLRYQEVMNKLIQLRS